VEGQIQQHAAPAEIYERPGSVTVARFMGVNVLSVEVVAENKMQLRGGHDQLELPAYAGETPSYIAIVPERTSITHDPAGLKNVIQGRLLKTQYRGGDYRLQVRIGGAHEGQIIEARSKIAPNGESLYVHLPVEAIHVIPQPREATVPGQINKTPATQVLSTLKEEIA
jgi:ABC-type Fe3+/spermidine/putrescine transport system ATPase subunit